jgi:hypothetical protein
VSQRNWSADGVTPDNQHHGRHRAKKNTRKWCGGHVGREHALDVRPWHWAPDRPCDYLRVWARDTGVQRTTRWQCREERFCTVCGKVFGVLAADECTRRFTPANGAR